MSKKKQLQKAKNDHQKFLEKMGVSKKQLKDRKKVKLESVYETNYGSRYYDDKPTGGIEYNPTRRHTIGTGENKSTMEEITRKNNLGSVMIDSQYGAPRDLGYIEKVIPTKLKI